MKLSDPYNAPILSSIFLWTHIHVHTHNILDTGLVVQASERVAQDLSTDKEKSIGIDIQKVPIHPSRSHYYFKVLSLALNTQDHYLKL